MVSGFFTSPWDHSRILSGEARLIQMALNDSGSLGFSKKLKRSFTESLLLRTPLPRKRERLSRGNARGRLSVYAPILAATSRAICCTADDEWSLAGALGSSISSTFRQSDCSSLSRTLKDSGRPDSRLCSPLTI